MVDGKLRSGGARTPVVVWCGSYEGGKRALVRGGDEVGGLRREKKRGREIPDGVWCKLAGINGVWRRWVW